jgi:hypothetical protein
MTEAEVVASGKRALIAKRPMSRIGRAIEKGETNGFMKVVVDENSKEILGAAILGTGGDENHSQHPRRYVRSGAIHSDSTRNAYPSDGVRADSNHAG